MATTSKLSEEMEKIMTQFMWAKFKLRDTTSMYWQEWLLRFEEGWEWQMSDYAGRRLLQNLGTEIYPGNEEAYFKREGALS